MTYGKTKTIRICESVFSLLPLPLRYAAGKACVRFIDPLRNGYIRQRRFYAFLKKSQWWGAEKLKQYQLHELKKLLRHAGKNIPYYRRLFQTQGLTPEDFRTLSDMARLPALTREEVINNHRALTVENLMSAKTKNRLEPRRTSGSTGTSMAFYRDKNYKFMKKAFFRWRNELAGLNDYDYHIHLWSRPFSENSKRKILHQPYDRKLVFSTLNVREKDLLRYLKLIKKTRPRYIMGSPSVLYHLACLAREKQEDGISIPVFLSTTENLYAFQKEAINRQFKCATFNYYHCEENVVSAVECEEHTGMHVDTRQSIVEIVDENGRPCPPGKRGRILCTSFNNYIMPLIRYDTGDIGSFSESSCPCGRNLPLLTGIEGRSSEIMSYNGRYIYPSALAGMIKLLPNIKECQFIQADENTMTVKIVKNRQYSGKDTLCLEAKLKKIAGVNTAIKFIFVEQIPRTEMGKFRFVENRRKYTLCA